MNAATGRFRRSDRLLASRDYRRVARSGQRVASRYFVLLSGAGREEPQTTDTCGACPAGPRLGITASRKVGRAVVRNRLKRSVREWFRRQREELDRGSDNVVIVRRNAVALDAQEIWRELAKLAKLLRSEGAR